MKNELRIHLKWQIITTIAVYLFVAFIRWDFLFISEIPQIDNSGRFVYIATFILTRLFTFAIVGLAIDLKNFKPKVK